MSRPTAKSKTPAKIQFFRTSAALRQWFAKHHTTAPELWVGYYKVASGQPSLTWPASVDEALCVGWIDGIRKSVDADRYTIRFTPRKPTSNWSAVNIQRVAVLTAEGRMQPAGLAAFAARQAEKSGVYAYEQRSPTLPEPYLGQLQQNAAAWAHYQAQAPSYQKSVNWWVLSAKQETTRQRRLAQLIATSAAGQLLPQFSWKKAPKNLSQKP